ncbi:MAG: fluoride efflux transporter CrcB [Porticoccaceae bacterium]|jgi:CrcB protein|nr:fluoride efflux transporter CrcB [Porticoccaceae bacterium]MEA3301014.1 fluoride efflux transporter CrcB [Pseudomonadota bacterium]HLS98601.1 fluoride efflux transporter CrcB [Porticoccaceae bacterium]
MIHWLAVAAGGALGALARYGVNGLLFPLFGHKFPLGTLVINVAGSLAMGVCYVLIIERGLLDPEWRNFLMVGVLGAFTTFSAFSLDAAALWQNGHLLLACGYVLASVALSLGALVLAIHLTRLL